MMKTLPKIVSKFLLLFSFFIGATSLFAQTGCPGCVVDLPGGFPEDTLYLEPIIDAQVGQYFEQDISFRMPKTTDPVNAIDPDTPAGLNISEITIVNLSNVPPGLSWEANQTTYDVDQETDGCMQLCGVPLVPGMYEIRVALTAQVSLFTRDASLIMNMYVAPATSSNDGFTITNSQGCESTVVAFENNLPSNGLDGVSYVWNFGNGNFSLDENPVDQTYTEPGEYEVSYEAIFDTTGYIMTSIDVLASGNDCDDIAIPFVTDGSPDLYINIYDPSGELLLRTEEITNTRPPVSFTVNIPLGEGTYEIEVKDRDGNLDGDDDLCGGSRVQFNQLAEGVFTNGDLQVQFNIIHPVDTIVTKDTVRIFPIPDDPTIAIDGQTSFCDGDMVELTASYEDNVQWYRDTVLLLGENSQMLAVNTSGNYWVEYTSIDGCTALSDMVTVDVFENPTVPAFSNVMNMNVLTLFDSTSLPADYALQWSYDGEELADENGFTLCAIQDGLYSLAVTDNETGCNSIFSLNIFINDNTSCDVNVSTTELEGIKEQLKVYPNPVTNLLNVDFELTETTDVEIQVLDVLGRVRIAKKIENGIGSVNEQFSLNDYATGLYLLTIKVGEEQVTKRVVKQ